MELASEAKHRLEINQRNRKKVLKAQFPDKDMHDNDSDYYTPKFFYLTKHPLTGEEAYLFQEKNKRGTNYWIDRDKGNWDHMPNIFDDDCKAFYE